MNAYGYCDGDPVGRSDPTGHIPILRALLSVGKRMANVLKPTMFKASTVSTVAGIAGFAVEATVELDEDSNNALIAVSSVLLGLGLGGMYRYRPPSAPRLSLASSRSSLPGLPSPRPTPPTRPPNFQRSDSYMRDMPFNNFEPRPVHAPRSSGAFQPHPIRIPRVNTHGSNNTRLRSS